jgi:hypothetical protein
VCLRTRSRGRRSRPWFAASHDPRCGLDASTSRLVARLRSLSEDTPARGRAALGQTAHDASPSNGSAIRPHAPRRRPDGRTEREHARLPARVASAPARELNDAYVENAGADHYLTDSFGAGHQVVREVVGRVTEQFVKDKGGRDKVLSFVVARIQEGAIKDRELRSIGAKVVHDYDNRNGMIVHNQKG